MDALPKKKTRILHVLEELVADETAGDPQSGKKWIRRTLRWLKEQLLKRGIKAATNTIRKYLKELGYSLKVNVRKMAIQKPPDRDNQFKFINETKARFLKTNQPVISVDAKKKELIGHFKNSGRTWQKTPLLTWDHDSSSVATEKIVPYGIYDLAHNYGFMYVGLSHETATFAVDGITAWWTHYGQQIYPEATELLILCDNGSANGCRTRLWKWELQEQLVDRLGLHVTVSHFPPGSSKWNPIEHRLFSFISLNWAGQPLDSVDLALGYMRSTQTSQGLKVEAYLSKKVYPTGQVVTDAQLATIHLNSLPICPQWNYQIVPRDETKQIQRKQLQEEHTPGSKVPHLITPKTKQIKNPKGKPLKEGKSPSYWLTLYVEAYPTGSLEHDVANLLLHHKPRDFGYSSKKKWSIRVLSEICQIHLQTKAASKSQVHRLLFEIAWPSSN